MTISPYFRNLRSAYNAELDDLTQDSEGLHVLDKRLAQRRKEMEFLVHMLEISPEMVATVFHKGFRFSSLAAMNHLVTLEADELPEWDSLGHAIQMEAWTQPLVEVVKRNAMGEWFLTVAAALEFLSSKPDHLQANDSDADADADTNNQADDEMLDDDERDAKVRDEAGADWMVEQGFDRKE
jgi:hypothetical protein